MWRLRILPARVWLCSQRKDKNVGLIGDTGSPAGVSGVGQWNKIESSFKNQLLMQMVHKGGQDAAGAEQKHTRLFRKPKRWTSGSFVDPQPLAWLENYSGRDLIIPVWKCPWMLLSVNKKAEGDIWWRLLRTSRQSGCGAAKHNHRRSLKIPIVENKWLLSPIWHMWLVGL